MMRWANSRKVSKYIQLSREQHSTRGLRLVQDFLGHLGSQLRIESQSGQVTTFTFALPQAL